ncbi:MAG: glycosyltransferase [Prevotella sp.]|uniref:glycosyltransferase n=2 Tax=Paramuribaculum intestinale TaxID=2094151 RepID=UPI000F465EBD|nr:glycosyltransferase [Paramuribaculum intestinale]MCX4294528.1 glycosyltransferase [Prevotella sp.]ROS89613.1 glycosyltransferase [Muribaculaceae bacterium Isolate-043 (Harlan)]WLT40859.1 glycosyltransferase [Paramuribaculum intestinale]
MKAYNTLIITDLAAFYKLKLFNKIACKKEILVIFIESYGRKRNEDFYSGERQFDYKTLDGSNIKKIREIISIIAKTKYENVIIGGWNSVLYWLVALMSKKKKNAVIVESSVLESKVEGSRALLKKLFLSRISKALVPGVSNEKLLCQLGFKGEIIKTHGVGLYNRNRRVPFRALHEDAKKFLYVGRLSIEKNLKSLITVFNDCPEWILEIVGFGPQEEQLKLMAKKNVIFRGAVKNTDLLEIYQKSDVFVLPSDREPWGLVVEEAINNGVPVALSSRVGAAEDWVGIHKCGLTFNPDDIDDIKHTLDVIANKEVNNDFRRRIQGVDFDYIEREQVDSFIF